MKWEKLIKNGSKPAALMVVSALCLLLAACGGSEERQQAYLDKANAHFEVGNFKKAQVDVRNVLQINENNAEARYLFALLHEREKNWQQMFANLQLAIESDPTLIGARIKLGQMYYANRRYEKTKEQADAVLALEEKNPDGLTLKGSVYYREGQLDKAVEQAQLALAESPGHVGAISILSEIYKEQDPERALAVIGDGIGKQSKDATLRLLKINVLEQQGDLDGVVSEYKTLIANHPENLFFHYRLVKFYEKHERIDEAEALLRDIVKAKPDNVDVKLWLAQFMASERDLSLAESTIKEFIKDQPELHELRFALAKVYLALRQFPDAEKAYEEIIAMAEEGVDSLEARNELVKLHLAQNRREPAETLLQEILAIEPENEAALVTQARLLLAENDYRAAIPRLRTALKNNPKSLEALLLLGRAHEAEGSVALALDNFRVALSLEPGNSTAILNIARLQMQRGELDSADRLLERFLERQPQHAEARRMLVESYSRQSRWEDALAQADILEKDKDNQVMGQYLKGRIFQSQGQLDKSIPLFEGVLEAEPTAIEALQFLARAYVQSGDRVAAYDYLTDHVAKHPRHSHAHELLGALQFSRGEPEKSIASYQAAIDASPDSVAAYLALAQIYSSQRDYDTALATYNAALENNPDDIRVLLLMAGIHERKGEYTEATEHYEKLLGIRPDLDVAANNLAMILVDQFPTQDNLERALALTQRFRDTDLPVYQNTMGWVYYKANDYTNALPLLKKAAEAEASPKIFHYHLGMTYYQLGNKESAKEALQLATADNAQYQGVEEAKAILQELRI